MRKPTLKSLDVQLTKYSEMEKAIVARLKRSLTVHVRRRLERRLIDMRSYLEMLKRKAVSIH